MPKRSPPPDPALPHDDDAERSILAFMLDDAEVNIPRARLWLSEDEFFSPRHRIIFRTLCRLYDRSAFGPDRNQAPVSLKIALAESGELEEAGGAAYIGKILDAGLA